MEGMMEKRREEEVKAARERKYRKKEVRSERREKRKEGRRGKGKGRKCEELKERKYVRERK